METLINNISKQLSRVIKEKELVKKSLYKTNSGVYYAKMCSLGEVERNLVESISKLREIQTYGL